MILALAVHLKGFGLALRTTASSFLIALREVRKWHSSSICCAATTRPQSRADRPYRAIAAINRAYGHDDADW